MPGEELKLSTRWLACTRAMGALYTKFQLLSEQLRCASSICVLGLAVFLISTIAGVICYATGHQQAAAIAGCVASCSILTFIFGGRLFKSHSDSHPQEDEPTVFQHTPTGKRGTSPEHQLS